MTANPSLERDLRRQAAWPAHRPVSSSVARAKRLPGYGPSAQTLGLTLTDLPPSIAARIQALSAAGDSLAASQNYSEAVSKYGEAWNLLPEPKNDWEASTWLLAAIGDACFLSGHFKQAQEAFAHSMSCPGGFGNPFLHMRLGQCELEDGNEAQAAEELCRAYALEGREIFASEHAKYFEFLKTKIQPPASGAW